jgi:hypothetical protein
MERRRYQFLCISPTRKSHAMLFFKDGLLWHETNNPIDLAIRSGDRSALKLDPDGVDSAKNLPDKSSQSNEEEKKGEDHVPPEDFLARSGARGLDPRARTAAAGDAS